MWSAAIFGLDGTPLSRTTGTDRTALVTFTRPAPDIARVGFTPSTDAEGIDTLTFTVPQPASALRSQPLGVSGPPFSF